MPSKRSYSAAVSSVVLQLSIPIDYGVGITLPILGIVWDEGLVRNIFEVPVQGRFEFLDSDACEIAHVKGKGVEQSWSFVWEGGKPYVL